MYVLNVNSFNSYFTHLFKKEKLESKQCVTVYELYSKYAKLFVISFNSLVVVEYVIFHMHKNKLFVSNATKLKNIRKNIRENIHKRNIKIKLK